MKVSFVVVTYQRHDLLRDCIDSILAQQDLPLPCEIIIVDNGGDADYAPECPPGVTLTFERPQDNIGAAGGREYGRARAKGEYIVCMDDDAEWHQPDAVARLVKLMDADSKCAAIAARSLMPSTYEPIIAKMPHPNKKYLLAASAPVEIPYFYSVGCILRQSAVEMAGGFPTRFFIYMEEVDLSLRLLDAGYHILYAPDVGVVHHFSQNGRPVHGDKYWYMNALNKARLGFRLLPYHNAISITFAWSLRTLQKTRKPALALKIWGELWRERALLREERAPIKPETLRYLKSLGASLLY